MKSLLPLLFLGLLSACASSTAPQSGTGLIGTTYWTTAGTHTKVVNGVVVVDTAGGFNPAYDTTYSPVITFKDKRVLTLGGAIDTSYKPIAQASPAETVEMSRWLTLSGYSPFLFAHFYSVYSIYSIDQNQDTIIFTKSNGAYLKLIQKKP